MARKSLKIILGSSSPWRRQILAEMGYEFESMSPDIDEKAIRRDDPSELVLTLAEAKSLALRPRIQEPCVLITSDQVVISGGRVLEKPRDEAEAREFIRRASDEPSSTVTAVMAVNTATGKTASGVDVANIWFDPVPEDIVDKIICKGDVYTCAGAIETTDPVIRPYVRRIDGDIDSVIGLPKKLTRKLIEEVSV